MELDEGLIKKLSAQACVDEATTTRVCKALADMLTATPLFDYSRDFKVIEPVQSNRPVRIIAPGIDDDNQWLIDNIGDIAHLVEMHLPKEILGTAWHHFSAMGVSRTATGQVDMSALTNRLRNNIIL